MEESFSECVERFKNATLGTDIRDALVRCMEILNASINIDRPTNCPNCGAAVSGKSANCEYCGTLLIWRK